MTTSMSKNVDMMNYDAVDVRPFQELRSFAREHDQVAFARMVTTALGCLISDDPASHRGRWAVDRVQSVLDQIRAGWPMTDSTKLDVIRATDTAPSSLIDAEAHVGRRGGPDADH